MRAARMKHRRVVHKSTAGIAKSIPEAVGLVGNPPPGLINNTVAPPFFDTGAPGVAERSRAKESATCVQDEGGGACLGIMLIEPHCAAQSREAAFAIFRFY
jgi:hypothetical protein